jgi:hypothetical protein
MLNISITYFPYFSIADILNYKHRQCFPSMFGLIICKLMIFQQIEIYTNYIPDNGLGLRLWCLISSQISKLALHGTCIL